MCNDINIGNNIDVVQNISCHFEQSETTFRSPAKGKGNLAESLHEIPRRFALSEPLGR